MATKPTRKRKPPADATAGPEPAEPAPPPKPELPEPVASRWRAVAANAERKRLRIEVRLKDDAPPPEPTEDGLDLRGSFMVYATTRTSATTKLGETTLFGSAVDQLERWVEGMPDLGADVLRTELRAFGRRLALLTPRELSHRRRGQDHAIYRDFRDRILPLAWDNLVDAVVLERFRDFVSKVATLGEAPSERDAFELRATTLAAEARDLVGEKLFREKEGTDDATDKG